ncbi:MAG: hypothetical protein ACOX7D_03510 [Alphaproteobacteria bacterium]|jgi:hypothetical protein
MRKIFAFLTISCIFFNATTHANVREARSARPMTENSARAATSAVAKVAARSGISNKRTNNKNVLQPRSVTSARVATPVIVARSAEETPNVTTRTGTAYNQCKSAYFACMDQFCTIKDPNYQRCSCSDRIFGITSAQSVMQDANAQLTTFTESLDAVGMTAAQATAMKQASEGELALTGDKSSSAAILQAIMNSIKGQNTNVGGVYEGLNTISLKMDDTSGFGFIDSGQEIAAYNGKNLYTAIYNKCREAVRDSCTDATLQRSVTAYLMAIEQDCNTVQKQLDEAKKSMTASVREASAMLDLARVKNRQERNSLDATACLNAVEKAVLSEEVCGANYHKCLDNGKYIDIKTGKPLEGVVEFYKLQELLSFSANISLADQKLAKNPNNRSFVNMFETKVKQFAKPELDKCQEIADKVWSDYLDKAMLAIYYAQREKVDEIKTGCMDFVSACYMNGSNSITSAMSNIINGTTSLTPGTIELLDDTCSKYVAACDNMFGDADGNGIIAQYIAIRKDQDLTDACRAVVKQCFDNFGGVAYNNFYNPISGIFSPGLALDWFTFKSYSDTENSIVSTCAKKLLEVDACNPADNPEFARKIFGGFDKYTLNDYNYYGLYTEGSMYLGNINQRQMHKVGVATEIYNQIVNSLSINCQNYGGKFVQKRFLNLLENYYYYQSDGEMAFCKANFTNPQVSTIKDKYNIEENENMCPLNYWNKVDTSSWGACLCWENGGRRSNNGTSLKCIPGQYKLIDSSFPANSENCSCDNGDCWCDRSILIQPDDNLDTDYDESNKDKNKICPYGKTANEFCQSTDDQLNNTRFDVSLIPEALK